MVWPHALSHKVFAYIYIYIYIDDWERDIMYPMYLSSLSYIGGGPHTYGVHLMWDWRYNVPDAYNTIERERERGTLQMSRGGHSCSCVMLTREYSIIWVKTNPTCLLNGSRSFNPNMTYLLNGWIVLTYLSNFIKKKLMKKQTNKYF